MATSAGYLIDDDPPLRRLLNDLLIDLSMPETGGLEVLDRLEPRSRPLIVTVSGHGDPHLRKPALAAAAAAYRREGSAIDGLPDGLAGLQAQHRAGAV